MKPSDMHDMTDADLTSKLKDTRVELFNLRFQLATGALDNPTRIKAVKKDIARLLTEMRSRELAATRDAAAS
jgi:large subunit ribosomal protein L29